MNFCVDCNYCARVTIYSNTYNYYCRKPCDVRYDYVTGEATTHISSDCKDVRKNNPDCPYFK